MAPTRRPVFFNEERKGKISESDTDALPVWNFHKQLPEYAVTTLFCLDDVAKQLGVKSVYFKSESSRFGLPAFKILGVSWGAFRAVTSYLGISSDASIEEVGHAAREKGLVLFAATEGNHGRAVARMAKWLGVSAQIYMPSGRSSQTRSLIESEGAVLVVHDTASYDDAIAAAFAASETTAGGILIQDNSFEGYQTVPQWIVEGYSTMLHEVDAQIKEVGDTGPIVVLSPVGVGSLAHAVVRHYKNAKAKSGSTVVSVEPDTAACLYQSLRAGGVSTSVQTARTIMAGMNCETVSPTAFTDLAAGVDISVTISDFESHRAVKFLEERGISAGPCGAASLAALWRLREDPASLGALTSDSVVVLLGTEGQREYTVPFDPSIVDPIALTQTLTKIDSSNPTLSKAPGAGEGEICHYIFSWLQYWDIEAHWLEERQGRPSVVGVLHGKGGGKSLMLNGHVDTVSLASYSPSEDPLSGQIDNGRLYGRGSLDMKSGVAAAMSAFLSWAGEGGKSALAGDVLLATVADEEDSSLGTEEVIKAGWHASAAVVTEPTMMEVVTAHKGFVWVEFPILGVAAHGSRPADGVDSILLAGKLQVALLEYSKTLPEHIRLGKASLHGGRIQGGEESSSYSALCTLVVEFRTVPGFEAPVIKREVTEILEEIARNTPEFRYETPRIIASRPWYILDDDEPFVRTFRDSACQAIGGDIGEPSIVTFWCDAALLQDAGIPAIVFGPKGAGLHSKQEWVDVKSVKDVTNVLKTLIADFCS